MTDPAGGAGNTSDAGAAVAGASGAGGGAVTNGGNATNGGVAGGAGLGNGGSVSGGALTTAGAGEAGGAAPIGGLGGTASVGGTGGVGGAVSVGGAAGAYNPCPALPEPCKIMASGDSITVGAQSTDTGGYRAPLFHMTLQHTQHVTLVGPSGAGPATVDGTPFPDKHDGHSGYIIDTVDTRKGLLPLEAENLPKFAPNIVLLMIGTNDVNSNVDVGNAPARLAKLLDLITTTSPNTLLVVAQITPTRTDSLNATVRTFNAALVQLVNARAEAGKHIMTVDMYGAFTANTNYKTDWLFDGLHPNDAGYAKMAKVWYAAIGGLLH